MKISNRSLGVVLFVLSWLRVVGAAGLSPDNLVSEHHWEVKLTPETQHEYGIQVIVEKIESGKFASGRSVTILVTEGEGITHLSSASFEKRESGRIRYSVDMAISTCGTRKCIRFLGVDSTAVDLETYVILSDSPSEGTSIANFYVIPLLPFIQETIELGVEGDSE